MKTNKETCNQENLGPRTKSHCVGVRGFCHGNRKGVELRGNSMGNFCSRCRRSLIRLGLVDPYHAAKRLRKYGAWGFDMAEISKRTGLSKSALSRIQCERVAHIGRDHFELIMKMDFKEIAQGGFVSGRVFEVLVEDILKELCIGRDHLATMAKVSLDPSRRLVPAVDVVRISTVREDFA